MTKLGLLSFVLVLAISAISRTATGQDEPPPLPPPVPAPPSDPAPAPEPEALSPGVREAPPEFVVEDRPVPPPLGRLGFQMAIRTGASFPMGELADNRDLKDTFGWQIPLFVEIGGKTSKHLFIAGYFGFGLGGSGGGSEGCVNGSTKCVGVSARMGAEIQYHFAPDDRLNPWIGYGVGFQWLSLTQETGGRDRSISATGWEYGRFSAGLDIRTSRAFGIGPFVDFAVGEYTSASTETNGIRASGDILRGAPHFWLTIGPRVVFYP